MSRSSSSSSSLSAAARRLHLGALCNPSPELQQLDVPQANDKPPQSVATGPSPYTSKATTTDDNNYNSMTSSPSSPTSPNSNTARSSPCSPASSHSRFEAEKGSTKEGSRHLSLDAEDESVMIAVSALDDMRSGASSSASPPSVRSNSLNGNLPAASSPRLVTISNDSAKSPSMSPASSSEEATSSAQFVSRMSGLPIVNTALRAYEHSKASSRVVKYGAEMMESSVKSISKPVINRLPVNQIDEFACRQLDRFGRYGNSGAPSGSCEQAPIQETKDKNTSNTGDVRFQSRSRFIIGGQEENDNHDRDRREDEIPASSSQEVANRSRWHSLLYEAGGISAAVSEESMRRLKFCLQWLQYATDHIDAQILVLRNFIASLNESESGAEGRPISASHMQTLTNVKRDVVNTIRQVVDVVSKYAGGALPEPARGRVKQFILHLPQRWANSAHRQTHGPVQAHSPGIGAGKRHRRNGGSVPASAASTAPSSPLHSPRVMSLATLPGQEGGGQYRLATTARPTAGSAAQAAQRILTLATESLDMMRSVTGIFKETLDRADTWVDRLRVIGIQRQQSVEQNGDISNPGIRERVTDTDGDVELSLPNRSYSHRHAGSGSESISDTSTSTSLSGTATATLTPYPPSPRSWSVDVLSPSASTSALHGVLRTNGDGSNGHVNGHGSKGGMAMAAKHLDALTLNSALATPRSSTQSLPSLAGRPGFEYEWEYAARKLKSVRERREAEERAESDGDKDREMDEDREDREDEERVERDAATVLSSMRGSAMDVDTKE